MEQSEVDDLELAHDKYKRACGAFEKARRDPFSYSQGSQANVRLEMAFCELEIARYELQILERRIAIADKKQRMEELQAIMSNPARWGGLEGGF